MEMLAGRSSIISKRCLSALQGFGELTGFTGNFLGAHRQWASLESVELLQDVGEFGFAFADDFGRGALERLFGGDAIDPALLGEFFVSGEIERDEQLYGAAVFGGGFSRFRLGFWFRFRGLGFFGLRRLRLRFRGAGGGGLFALQFVLELFVEAEGLLPAFEFVAGPL